LKTMKEKMKENKTVRYFLELDYPITIYRAEEGGYVAEIEDLPGCVTEGETLEEVTQRIEDARKAWIETAYEDGMKIPLPRTHEQYSGKFMVRIPKYLHRRLAEQAKREGVSLNQYVESILAQGASTQDVSEKILARLENQSRKIDISGFPLIDYGICQSNITWPVAETGQRVYDQFMRIQSKERVAV